ncbi:nuclear transport factor 2 family protein [Pseudoalteromonas rubra]|uniref:nuclear transport factor 2 family protein n=1 Tax=Pseudoalteromonas rubra TaxID=43658 RepID=UPI002DB9314D|nr:nuclear transport factor 2 family protein [Pseudoalteromonas rubra]MEC4090409.1 nuclear transport factor 2 family protein [Pseudoalteromonas rubra]
MRGTFTTQLTLCLVLLVTFLIAGCGLTDSTRASAHESSALRQVLNDYIATYQARQDFALFLSFYADDVQLEDMIYGFAVKDKQALAEFFNWSAGNVKILDGKQTYTLSEVILDEQQRRAVIRGTYVRFEYEGREMGPWRFTTVLHFNPDNKIAYQQDWINYRPRSLTDGGSNLNYPAN